MIITNYHRSILFGFLILSAMGIQAQSIPIGSIPIFYNGGFAGEAGSARMAAFSYFGAGGKGIGSAGFTNIVSYDNFFKKTRLGIGVMAGQSNATYTFYNTQMLFSKVSLSPKFSFKGKYTFAPFVDFSIAGTSASGGAGFLINSLNSYIGLSYSSFLNSKKHSNNYPFPLLQAGHTFKRTPESKFSATLQLALGYNESTIHTDYFHKDLNVTFKHGKFIWGANLFSGGALLGFQDSNLKVQFNQSIVKRYYNTDTTTGNQTLSTSNLYNCSISIRYIFKKAKPFQV